MLTIPALSLEALLTGLAACGQSEESFRRRFQLASSFADPFERFPLTVWDQIWAVARQQDKRPELPVLVALAIPFGKFGMVDYLAGSSETVGGGLQSLSDYFSVVAAGTTLELSESGLRLINTAEKPRWEDEFLTCLLLNRFRQVTGGKFQPSRVLFTAPAPPVPIHETILQVSVTYGASLAGFDLSAENLALAQTSSDAGLHRTLAELVKKLSLGDARSPGIQVLVRSRLRSLVPSGRATMGDLAKAIGLSERTLHRRLSEAGESFQELLDKFRIEEAERLLLIGEMPLSQIAQHLGYADQASWTRAFTRFKGVSPKAWLKQPR